MSRKKLKQWREEAGLTQQELADRLGVHVQYVSAIERGARRPGMGVAVRIRDVTNGAISVEDLAPPPRKAA